MKNILTVFKKEVLDTFRDKRTLITSIIIPLVLLPAIIMVTSRIQENAMEDSFSKKIKIGWVNESGNSTLENNWKLDTTLQIIPCASVGILTDSVREEKYDAGIVIDKDFSQNLANSSSGKIQLFYNSKEEAYKSRVLQKLEFYKQSLLVNRLQELQLKPQQITPMVIEEKDVATNQQLFGKYFGGFLPYIFIIFCFLGCMLVVIDLFTGEKERSTLETILTSPVNRMEIMIGKMGVAVLIGVLTAILSITGILLYVRFGAESLPPEVIDLVSEIFDAPFILTLILMLIPLTIFFTGMLIPLAIYARNFKEAQSIVSPMNFVIILPAMVAMFPGVKLTLVTAMIPITNIALCTKYMIAGDSIAPYLPVVVTSLIVYAALAILLSYRQFSRESNLIR